MATLMVSQGVPMMSAGDELGRTQSGNNNAYCQDSPLSWIDWSPSNEKTAFLAFVSRVVALRKTHAVLRQTSFLREGARWLRPDGGAMSDADWRDPERRTLVLHLGNVFIVLNASDADVAVMLPALDAAHAWKRCIDTAFPQLEAQIVPPESPFLQISSKTAAILVAVGR
jgi:glycogen operon protein